MKIIRFFDWRFCLSLAFLLLVAYLVVGGLDLRRENAAKSEHINVLITQAEAERESAETDRANASAERAQLLAGQRTLEAKYDALVTRQAELLAWLRENGVDVPDEFAVAPAAESGRVSIAGSGDSTPLKKNGKPVKGKAGQHGKSKTTQKGKTR